MSKHRVSKYLTDVVYAASFYRDAKGSEIEELYRLYGDICLEEAWAQVDADFARGGRS